VVRKRRTVDSELCLSQGLQQPRSVERCHVKHCSLFHWTSTDWSQVGQAIPLLEVAVNMYRGSDSYPDFHIIIVIVVVVVVVVGKSSESVQCAMLKACDACADIGQL